MTGVSMLYGGFVNNHGERLRQDGYGDYAAFNSHHWVYEGTGLGEGDRFGWDAGIVGPEVDGADMSWVNGIPVVTGIGGTPNNYRILALSPAGPASSRGHGTMGIYFTSQHGAVFNAATINWARALASDSAAGRITSNVLTRFLSKQFPPVIDSWYPFRVFSDSIHHELVQLNRRTIAIPLGTSIRFGIQAEDPMNEAIGFLWKVNGRSVSGDPSFTYQAVPNDTMEAGANRTNSGDTTIIVAHAYNLHDTATISWKVYNCPLKIVSDPPRTTVNVGECFYYKLDVARFGSGSIQFDLSNAPIWLSVDWSGVIRSQPIWQVGRFSAQVHAFDQNNNADFQRFEIVVSDPQAGNEPRSPLPSVPSLAQNYPNPFNPVTTIQYGLPHRAHVTVTVFNTLGQQVAQLVNGDIDAGYHKVKFDGRSLASGVYFYRLQTSEFVQTRKLLVVR